jgi:hypothetical protein
MSNAAVGINMSPWDRETVENRYGHRAAALLTQATGPLPHDVSERLRVARARALESARWAQQPQAARARSATVDSGGSVALGGETGWGWRLASLVPAVALIVGLVFIQKQGDIDQIRAAADIDAALLADDLPPDAYTDAGFAEYLRGQER